MYLQGQNIVREGEIVTLSQYKLLDSLGLLENAGFDYNIYGGAILLVFSAMMLFVLIQKLIDQHIFFDLRRISVIMLVMVITMGISIVLSRLASMYVAPVATTAMLLTGLIGWQSSIPASICISILVSGLAAGGSTTTSAEMV